MRDKRLEKVALGDQHGIFQHFQSDITDYPSRERYLSLRGGEPTSRDRLYGITSEKEASYVPTEYVAPHLSTRYSPDRVGVQAMRVPGSNGGVFQDPYTKKIYDYNEGFTTESGRDFPPGGASLQTSLMSFADSLESSGLKKEAEYLNSIISDQINDKYSKKIARKTAAITKDMIKIANHLDSIGLHTEANVLDQALKKRAGRLRNWADALGFDTGQWARDEAADMEPQEIASIALSLPLEKQRMVVDMLFDDPMFREMAVSTLSAQEVVSMAKALPPSVQQEAIQLMMQDPEMIQAGMQGVLGGGGAGLLDGLLGGMGAAPQHAAELSGAALDQLGEFMR